MLDLCTCFEEHLKLGSHLPWNFCYLLQCKPFKSDGQCCLVHYKSSFRSQEIECLSWLINHVEKTAWLELSGKFQNFWRHNLQYTYCPISYEVKATKQWNLKFALLQISCRKWVRGTSSKPLFAEKSFAWVKSKGSAI